MRLLYFKKRFEHSYKQKEEHVYTQGEGSLCKPNREASKKPDLPKL
jgi:hypothetical protein